MLASPHPQPPTFPQNSKGWHVKKVAQLCLGVSLTSMCESESLQTIAVFARLQKKKHMHQTLFTFPLAPLPPRFAKVRLTRLHIRRLLLSLSFSSPLQDQMPLTTDMSPLSL